ncbi:MAG: ArsR/SmtB family transcription factor [Acidimicrobiales bacterium]
MEWGYQVQGREFKDAIFEQFARAATAFGSPKRVEIVDLLAQGERTVESIAKATGMLVANTSRHLQVLRNAGMLTSRREGLHVVYRVADDSVVAGYRGLRTLAESRISEVRQLAEAFFGEVDGADPVGVDELLARSKAGEVVVVDVRPRLEFEAGHLPGAISIPLEELSQRISELDPDTAVVAYCRGPYCVLAAQAVAKFRATGLHAERLASGPPDWRAAGVLLAVGATPAPTSQHNSARKRRVKGTAK